MPAPKKTTTKTAATKRAPAKKSPIKQAIEAMEQPREDVSAVLVSKYGKWVLLGIIVIITCIFFIQKCNKDRVDANHKQVKENRVTDKGLQHLIDSMQKEIDSREVFINDLYNSAVEAHDDRLKTEFEGEQKRAYTQKQTDEIKQKIYSKDIPFATLDSIRTALLRARKEMPQHD